MISASKLRIHANSYSGIIAMKIELIGCAGETPALGMESGAILDSQITASSATFTCPANLARKGPSGSTACSAWCADDSDASPSLTLDLSVGHVISAIDVQGQTGYGRVTSFTVQYALKPNTPFTLYPHVSHSCFY